MKKPILFAHRGFSAQYPENSPLAFQMAAEKTDVDGVESDVHLTKDGKLVIIHDDTLERTSNGTGRVSQCTYEELLELDIGAWKGPQFAGQRIWTLEQLLDFCAQTGLILNLELKNSQIFSTELERRVIDAICRRKMQDRVYVSSFNHVSMRRFKKLCPDIETGLLYDKPLWDMRRCVARSNADNVHPRYGLLQCQPDLVEAFHERGMKIIVWTVDGEEDIRDMLARGVDGIIANRADTLCRVAAAFAREEQEK